MNSWIYVVKLKKQFPVKIFLNTVELGDSELFGQRKIVHYLGQVVSYLTIDLSNKWANWSL